MGTSPARISVEADRRTTHPVIARMEKGSLPVGVGAQLPGGSLTSFRTQLSAVDFEAASGLKAFLGIVALSPLGPDGIPLGGGLGLTSPPRR